MEHRFKAITAGLGLLTAITVLFGAVTDQGWLPSFVKRPTQDVLPGQQAGEQGGDGNGSPSGTDNSSTSPPTAVTVIEPTKPTEPAPVSPDTCISGYVWREAVPDDHVCVTPEMRDQVRLDNQQAESRRSPTGGPYGPDTCISGYVWRVAIPSDLVCVTPEMRDQVQADNQLADGRRVG